MNAKKTLLAAAVAAVLPLSALAQAAAAPAPLVQVYGTFNVNLQYTQAKGATAGTPANVDPRPAISIDSTNVGVRGTADLSHGLKAVYQCETQASVDGEDLRSLCNRNSRLGLSGGFGTVFYGNWDTPYKAMAYGTKADDPFGNTDVFGHQGIMGSPGFGVRSTAFGTGTANPGFDGRAGNSVAYWTPKFSGVTGRVQWGVDEYASADGVVNPWLLSAAVNFDQGPLSVAGAIEYHEDFYGIRTMGTPASRNASKDLGWKVGAGYELPLGVGALTVMGWLEQLSYKQDNAPSVFKEYSRFAWLAGAKFKTGNHEFRARYSMALGPSITPVTGPLPAGAEDDLGAQHYALGYAYNLAKDTQVYLFYTQIMNEDRARYTFGVSGAAAVVGANTAAGSDPMAFGLGMRQAF